MLAKRLLIWAAMVLVCGSDVSVAQNTDGTWTANAAGNWSTTTNWSGGTVADGIGYSAFLSNAITADRIITLDTARTIGNIYAQDTSNNYTISGANTLTLDTSSGQSILNVVTSGRTLNIGSAVTVNDGIEKTGAGAVSVSGAISLGGAQTWTNNSAGAFSTAATTGLITTNGHQLTLDGTGTFNIGGITNANPAISGSGSLVKNGSGRVNFGGNNSGFTGTVTINGGVMQFHNVNEPMGLGNLTLNGGVMSFYWGATYTRTLGTGNSQVQILGGESGFAGAGTTGPTINLGASVMWGANGEGSGATGFFNPTKFVLGDAGTGNAAVTTFSSGINLNGASRTISVPYGTSSAGNSATISAAITNSFGTGGLIKEGGGRLTLSANSTWNGNTTVSAGTLFITNNNTSWGGSTTVSGGFLDMGGLNLANIGGGSGRNITVSNGATIRFNTLSNAILNRLAETIDEIGVMTGTTSNNLDFSSSTGANLPNAFLGNWASNGAKMEYSGTLTPASDNYRLGAPRNAGLLGMTNTAAMTGSQGLIVGNGSVQLVGAKTFTGDTVIRPGARLGLAAFTGGSEALALQNSVLDVGSAGGNFWLHSSTATGPISGSANTTSAVFGGLQGTRNLSAVYSTTTGANNSAAQAVTAITGFTLNLGDGKTVTYSGSIGGFGVGASGGNGGSMTLAKTGLGTQVLTGVHTYTGATSITGGTLRISGAGSINSSSGITLNGGQLDYTSSVALSAPLTFTSGTLGGTNWTGAQLDNLTIGAGRTISPGNSPGTASTGNQTWASGGNYTWEINNATATAGTDPGWDLLSGTGTLDITATSGNEYTIFITSLDLANDPGEAVNFVDGSSYEWLIADFVNPVTGFNVGAFTLDTSAFQNAFTGTFAVALGDTVTGGDTSQIYITYVAVPEPAALALAALGLGGGFAAFRRMKKTPS